MMPEEKYIKKIENRETKELSQIIEKKELRVSAKPTTEEPKDD